MFSVYCHENKASGKVYVGITSQDPYQRWLNGGGYKKNEKFYADIREYGWDGFDHKVICDGLTEQQAVAIEKQLITAYDSVRKGYNKDPGGKYAAKRALCHAANEVKRGLKKHEFLPGAGDVLDTFALAEKSGKNSAFCQNINDIVNAIISVFQNDGRPIEYWDGVFLGDFLWEWRRFFKLHEFIVEHDENEELAMEFLQSLPKYDSRERAEMVEGKILGVTA